MSDGIRPLHNGNPITKEGLDLHKDDDVILGFSGGSTEIIATKKREDGSLEVTGSFKKDGAFYAPPNDQLAVHHLSTGEKLCTQKTNTDKPLAIAVLIDTSGSMISVLDTVKYSTGAFLNSLPSSSMCAVATFKLGFEYGHTHYQACNGGNFGYENATASGGTDIYFVLADAYRTLAGDYFKNHQKAVVIITDGYTLNDEKRKQELLTLKGNTLTFVSFLGGDHRDQLEGITDSFLPQDKNIKDGLKKYFTVLSDAYNTQKTVIAHKCANAAKGGTHASP